MRILITVDCYLPSSKSGAMLIHDLGVEFRRQGHEVTILTPSDTIPVTFYVSTEDGLRIVRVKSGRIKGTAKVIRAIREVRLSPSIWRCARHFLLTNPADLILFYSPTIFFGELVRLLKRRWGCPAYLILRDIFPQWAVDTGILRKGFIWKYFRKKEVEQYETANRIGVQSPANVEYFVSQFPTRRFPLEVLYNWASLDGPPLVPTNLRRRFGLQDKVIFLYGGNLGVAQDMDNIVRLAERLSSCEKAYFLLVGGGSEASRLDRIIRGKGLSNIQILPEVPHPEYLAMLTESDVGLISLDRRLRTHNLPGKLLSYMHCAMPTLASVNAGNDLREILIQNQAGFCLVNGDDDGLCSAALRLANDPELRKRMGWNSRKLLERQFSVKAAAAQILMHFQPETVKPIEGAAVEVVGTLVPGASFPTE